MEEFKELIFEVSRYRSSILKEIDENFKLLKKDKNNEKIKKQLVANIRKFTGVEEVVFSLKKDFLNASVVPIYNRALSLDLLDIFQNFKAGQNIRNLEVVEELSKYVQKFYVVFGEELIDLFSPRELTAILLHECGHVLTYTSNLPRILLSFLGVGIGILGKTSQFLSLVLIELLSLPVYLVLILIIIITARSLTFMEHRAEYKADQFAAKYGYGDEMIKVLYRLHLKYVERRSRMAWWEKAWEFLDKLFFTTTHPLDSLRIAQLEQQMITEYKKLYPELSNEISIILKDVKSS